ARVGRCARSPRGVNQFSADWLRLREPHDAAARSSELARRYSAALGGARGVRRIVDLAAGSGANFRALAPAIDGDQDWLLIDSDPAMLAAQAPEISLWSRQYGWRCRNTDAGVAVETATAQWRARALQLDLAKSLEQIELDACDAITTSAF